MRQFTIAEWLIAATLLPLSAMLAVPYLTAALLPFLGEANAVYARIVIGLAAIGLVAVAVLAIARGIARPLAETADTIDAIAYAELASAPAIAAQPGRNRASDVCHRQTCGGPG